MSRFRDHPCFHGGDIRISDMGAACHKLSDVLERFPEAEEARQALGDPFLPARNRRALAVLSGLPARTQQRILDAYTKKVTR